MLDAHHYKLLRALIGQLVGTSGGSLWIKAQEWAPVNAIGDSGATPTVNWGLAKRASTTLTATPATFTFEPPPGPCTLLLKLTQDGAGGHTAVWPASVKWSGATPPTLTAAPGAVDIVTFFFDGTTYYGVASLNFA